MAFEDISPKDEEKVDPTEPVILQWGWDDDISQKEYQIQYKREEDGTGGDETWVDTGRIESSEMEHEISEDVLKKNAEYVWRVTIWYDRGDLVSSGWSKEYTFISQVSAKHEILEEDIRIVSLGESDEESNLRISLGEEIGEFDLVPTGHKAESGFRVQVNNDTKRSIAKKMSDWYFAYKEHGDVGYSAYNDHDDFVEEEEKGGHEDTGYVVYNDHDDNRGYKAYNNHVDDSSPDDYTETGYDVYSEVGYTNTYNDHENSYNDHDDNDGYDKYDDHEDKYSDDYNDHVDKSDLEHIDTGYDVHMDYTESGYGKYDDHSDYDTPDSHTDTGYDVYYESGRPSYYEGGQLKPAYDDHDNSYYDHKNRGYDAYDNHDDFYEDEYNDHDDNEGYYNHVDEGYLEYRDHADNYG